MEYLLLIYEYNEVGFDSFACILSIFDPKADY